MDVLQSAAQLAVFMAKNQMIVLYDGMVYRCVGSDGEEVEMKSCCGGEGRRMEAEDAFLCAMEMEEATWTTEGQDVSGWDGGDLCFEWSDRVTDKATIDRMLHLSSMEFADFVWNWMRGKWHNG